MIGQDGGQPYEEWSRFTRQRGTARGSHQTGGVGGGGPHGGRQAAPLPQELRQEEQEKEEEQEQHEREELVQHMEDEGAEEEEGADEDEDEDGE